MHLSSNLDNENKNSNPNNGVNYIAFASIVKSEPVDVNERDDDVDQFDSSKEELDDDRDIYESFDQFFEESFKFKKVNNSAFKKL